MVARAVRERHALELAQLGVEAVQPEFEAGIEMVRRTLAHYQFNDATRREIAAAIRKDLYGGV
jgi:hypothetical protein